MKNNDLVITVCLSLFEPDEVKGEFKKRFSETYQTDNVIVISGMGFNQIAITNPITNETTLLNNKHD
jgi:hypothetical protein